MRLTYTVFLILIMAVLNGCKSKAQDISLIDLLNQKPREVFQSKNIRFGDTDINDSENYNLRLYGEKLPERAVKLVEPEYTIDWDDEAISPALSCFSVPLLSPQLLLDSAGKILIATADIGNDGPKGEAKGGVFTDDDVIKLRTALSEKYGKEKMVRKDSYEGNVYVWKKDGIQARLTIENESFENKSKSTRNGVAQNGRHGVLTIYNGVNPEFNDKSYDYFNDPEIRK